jgi:antirestriction protein ArdC
MAAKKRTTKAKGGGESLSRNAVYDIVVERITAMLDSGVVPWRKPWKGGGANAPRNLDGRRYSGINAFLLGALGYADPRFLTYKKASELGGKVTPGEKGYPVFFWKQLTITETDETTGKTKQKRIPLLRYFTVFNVAQVEGVEFKALPAAPVAPDPVKAAEDILEGMPSRPTIRYDQHDRAYYVPATDTVHVPPRSSFTSVEGMYETLFHEVCGHATGHASRLNREGITGFDHFGSDQYGREELVAHFTVAFLMGEIGMEAEALPNIAAYIGNWKSAIAADPKVLVWAAGRAQKAADYVLNRLPAESVEPEAVAVAA